MSKQYSFIDCNYFDKNEENDKNMFKNAIKKYDDLEKLPKNIQYYNNTMEVKDVEKGV